MPDLVAAMLGIFFCGAMFGRFVSFAGGCCVSIGTIMVYKYTKRKEFIACAWYFVRFLYAVNIL